MTAWKKPVLAAILAGLLTLGGCQKSPDAAFEGKVRAYLLQHPEVIEEALKALQAKKLAQAETAAKVALATHRQALERDPRDFVANPDGKITVVEFFDYRCGYCKLLAPEVLALIRDNPDIRFVFKELPIFGGVSDLAASVALTPAAKAKGLAVFQSFMAERALDEAAIARRLASLDIDPAAARRASGSAEIRKQLADTHALATSLGIEGTPAFIIGDRLVPGADMPAVRAAIAQARIGPLKRPG